VSIVHLDLLDDRTKLADEIDRNGVRDKHLVLLFWSTPRSPLTALGPPGAAGLSRLMARSAHVP
jgi:hypothetical protein